MKNILPKILVPIILWILFPAFAQGQFYSSGQDPASVKWHQINTPGFKVIFPEGYEKTARYVANVLEYAALLDTITLSTKHKKIPIILHNQTAISNAQTIWAPRRIDMYTIPPQDTYGQEWFQQLALHEYRHIIQTSKLNQGLTQVLTYVFGEQITGAVLGLYVPLWFLEGDAVAAETELSKTGRGRSPGFAMPLRAQFLEKKIYTYDKAVLGSYKNYVPNHYILGYHVVAAARETYGTKIWNHTLDKVGRNPWMIVPFSEGIRDISKKNKTTLYGDLMTELKQRWQQQLDETKFTPPVKTQSPKKHIFTEYKRPFQTDWKTIIAEKRALDDIPRFVEIDSSGQEKVIYTPGYYLSGSLSYGKKNMAWLEYSYDPRWENRNFSIVKIFDFETRKVRILRKKTRYFAPSFSPNGEQLVAVEVNENQDYQLVILDVAKGETIRKLSSANDDFFSYPTFSEDGKKIVCTTISNSGNRFAIFDLETGNMEYLMDTLFTEISMPRFYGDKIIFVGAWSGINNLFMMDLESRQISQITNMKFGLSDPSIALDRSILFSNYTANGFEICSTTIKKEELIPLVEVQDNSVKLYKPLAKQAGKILDPAQIPEVDYKSRKYSKLANLFNIHSWGPISIDADNYDIKPGISLLSQNVLSSSFTSLGWEYDLNEKTGKYYINYTYEGWYPALDFRADYGRRNSYTTDTAGKRIDFSWMETNFSSTIRVPLNFTTNKYARFLQPSMEFEYVQLDMDEDAQVSFKRNNYKALSYRLYASNLLKRTARDMNPRWGQVLDLNYQTAPFGNDSLGSMFAAITRLYFPGIVKHHSFNIYAGYQKRFDYNPLFSTIVRYPRGFSGLYSDDLKSLSFNYKLPICYPDFSLTSLAYIKRIKVNLFFDYARGLQYGSNTTWQSTGFELFADLHILRFLAPFEIGYRFIYRPDFDDVISEFLFSVNMSF